MVKIPIVTKDDVEGKIVLIREDHNIVKKGKIDDDYRLKRSKPLRKFVIDNGGYPILMTHIGRPRDKKTGNIIINPEESVGPLAEYIKNEEGYSVKVPDVGLSRVTEKGLPGLDDSVSAAIDELKAGKVQIVYLPNTRWFTGEEEKEGPARDRFTEQLASIADIFVNNAFGSHQPHVSTYWITKKLPSYAGFLMMEEIGKLEYLLNLPKEKRPFLAVVAGEKIDTKIGALESLREVTDHLLVGGLPANALICAKYGVKINGVERKEINIAKNLLEKDKGENKLLVPHLVVVSETECSKENFRTKYREVNLNEVKRGSKLGYIYDISPDYFWGMKVADIIQGAKTIFTNAVVGFDKAGFTEGTVSLYQGLARSEADHNFGGGDTLKALKKYVSQFYQRLQEDERHTLFTGGGTILRGFEKRGVKGMEVIEALIDNGGRKPK